MILFKPEAIKQRAEELYNALNEQNKFIDKIEIKYGIAKHKIHDVQIKDTRKTDVVYLIEKDVHIKNLVFTKNSIQQVSQLRKNPIVTPLIYIIKHNIFAIMNSIFAKIIVGQSGTKWDKVGQSGTKWDKVGQSGKGSPKQSHLCPSGPNILLLCKKHMNETMNINLQVTKFMIHKQDMNTVQEVLKKIRTIKEILDEKEDMKIVILESKIRWSTLINHMTKCYVKIYPCATFKLSEIVLHNSSINIGDNVVEHSDKELIAQQDFNKRISKMLKFIQQNMLIEEWEEIGSILKDGQDLNYNLHFFALELRLKLIKLDIMLAKINRDKEDINNKLHKVNSIINKINRNKPKD